jgi:hypothetical protein
MLVCCYGFLYTLVGLWPGRQYNDKAAKERRKLDAEKEQTVELVEKKRAQVGR